MEYSIDYQYSMNITWFLLGIDDCIAEFDSGGAIIPDIIAKYADKNQELINYFDNLPIYTEIQINPQLDKYINPNSILEPPTYGYYAKRGLISFDKINPSPGNNCIDYHLIAQPVEQLNFHSLPDRIKEILIETRQPINFKNFYKIDAGYKPWASLFTDYYVPLEYEPKPNKKRWFWQ